MTTPSDVRIAPRPLKLDWPDDLPRHWYGGDVFATHWMNAMSLTFPHGEKFFIDSVRAYRERNTDPVLEAQIRGFIGQEGWHRHEHAAFNAWLARLGLPAEAIEARAGRKIEALKRSVHPRGWLASTVCLEHFTAILAKDMLAHPERTAGMHPHFRRLWTWHSMEELEHKAVAYDLWEVTGGKYSTRVRAMLLVSVNFAWDIGRNVVDLLRADGQLWKPSVWWRGARFLFGRDPGLFWKVLPMWLAFFRRDFHPWQEDDRGLIREARASIEPLPGPA
jgi:hypothetical protein